MMRHDFAGRGFLVTGAASGIGYAIAQALAVLGARLVLTDIDDAGLERAQAALAGSGRSVLAIPGDLCDPAAVASVAERAFAAGPVDGLVNCAGIYPVTGFLDLPVEEWDRVLATNLRGPFLVTQAVARRMAAAGVRGAVVNISSTASVLARPGIAHYGASKAGLNQLTRVLAVELAPHGIRVNAVLPGVIATETVLRAAGTEAARREMEAKTSRIPAGRLGEPAEIAPLVLFLLSPGASYCTGGLFTADGGFSLGLSKY